MIPFSKMYQICGTILLLILHLAQAQLDRTGWTVSTGSSEPGFDISKVLDGNLQTFWQSKVTPTAIPFPHVVVIDMKKLYNVNALQYTPRQDGKSDGNVGQHRIEVSSDGEKWGSPVVGGTWLDDSHPKKSTFVTTPARFVRFTAITEAAGRVASASAADIKIYAAASFTSAPTALGQWGPTIDFPVVPVAAAILHDTGKVLVWSSWKKDAFSGSNGAGFTFTAIYDPVSGTTTQRRVSETKHDMFCPGLSMDALGRPFVTGGDNSQRTSIYDPSGDKWISGPDMNIKRGYQSEATTSEGKTFVIGGSWSDTKSVKNGEIYNPATNTWSLLPGCPVAPMLTNDIGGVYRQDNHGWLFGWKSGFVFQAGPSKTMNWYGTAGKGTVKSAGLRGDDPDAMLGNAVMYDAVAGKILALGGALNYTNTPATANAHIITIGAPNTTPTVTKLGPMHYARVFHNSVVLPDGKVVIIGGLPKSVGFSDTDAIFPAELWDPVTSRFTVINPISIPRPYHSIGLLLQDGTVLSAGGGLCGTCVVNHFDGEIYRPPYLFKADGSLATRPQITSIVSTNIAVGGTITVTTNTSVTKFALIRYGTATHTVDTDQRRIPLTPQATGNTYKLTVPNDAGIALPGSWMLFALDAAGVPSIAKTVLIRAS